MEFKGLRDADSRKGAMWPFCVPIHKRKTKNHIQVFGLLILQILGKSGLLAANCNSTVATSIPILRG